MNMVLPTFTLKDPFESLPQDSVSALSLVLYWSLCCVCVIHGKKFTEVWLVDQ